MLLESQDGVATMSGHVCKQEFDTNHVHCAAHILNLAVNDQNNISNIAAAVASMWMEADCLRILQNDG